MSTPRTLSDWFVTPQGQYVMMRELQLYDRSVSDLFGFNALQLGLPQHNLLRNSRMPLHIRAGKETGVRVWLEPEELPFESDSLDLVLLPHILEFSPHPHEILREVERVLRPEGRVIISGFNPYSAWGMRRLLGKKSEYPWNGHFISASRMKDWLKLLGIEVEEGDFCCFAPPFRGFPLMPGSKYPEPNKRHWWSAVGGVYFLQAKKRVPGMRLIKPKWNGRLVSKLLPVAPKLNREGQVQRIREDASRVAHFEQ